MRVRDATDIGEGLVQLQMRRQIGGGAQIGVDDAPVEIGDDDLRRRQLVIGNTARLDRDEFLFARDAADIAEGEHDDAAAHQLKVRLQDFLAQSLQ